MIPGWKIRRELSRLGQQLRSLPEAFWEPIVTRRYDRRFPAQISITEGWMTPDQKVALLLIYPHPDLGDTTVNLCKALSAAAFAPLVVSNAPIDPADRNRLAPHVWKIAVRPNLGHDFGGYRDGLRLLRNWDVNPAEVLILNDSVWLVDGNADKLINALRRQAADVAGSVLRNRDGASFLESYCYLIQGHVLRHPRIRSYWDNMVLTSNKYKVIRRGERGHSAALLDAGFGLAAVYDEISFRAAVAQATTDELADTLRHGAFLHRKDQQAALAMLEASRDDEWRPNVMALIERTLQNGQFYSLFPVLARNHLRYPFLKRSSDRVAVLWRRAFLSAVNAKCVAPPDAAVLAALHDRVAKDAGIVDLS